MNIVEINFLSMIGPICKFFLFSVIITFMITFGNHQFLICAASKYDQINNDDDAPMETESSIEKVPDLGDVANQNAINDRPFSWMILGATVFVLCFILMVTMIAICVISERTRTKSLRTIESIVDQQQMSSGLPSKRSPYPKMMMMGGGRKAYSPKSKTSPATKSRSTTTPTSPS